MKVDIRPINSKKDIKKFVQFANNLYKNCENYCPPLFSDDWYTN